MTQSPNLIIIFGPPAVGKMTVGHALSKQIGYPLFHNHMAIEMVLPFFQYGHPSFHQLVKTFRQSIFDEIIKTKAHQGLIFTWVWSLENGGDKAYIDQLKAQFESPGGQVYFVELEAHLDTLLTHNKSEFRLKNKPSKRNLEASENNLRQTIKTHQLNTQDSFFYPDHHLKCRTDQQSPPDLAKKIKSFFDL